MDISEPQIGMEIALSYQVGSSYDYITDTFLLSGYYTDYISARTNNRGYVYVSTAFKDSLNVSQDNSVTAMIRFQDNDDVYNNCERLQRKIDFTEKQTFEIVPLGQANGVSVVLAVIVLAVFISFSGYLLIYNILDISVVKDVQFYGRLKTIGTNERQIKRMLVMEGCYYWGVSLSLMATIGTAIFIVLYVIFSQLASYAVFSYPFIPLVLVPGMVLLICVIVPIWTYKTDIKLPVVERLRISEKG